jgi:hypothetical protein
MNAIVIADVDRTFIRYVYNAIRGSGQFEGACIKWKALPENERQTIAHIRTFFSRKYDIFDAKQNLLHQAGVANSVQLQELQPMEAEGPVVEEVAKADAEAMVQQITPRTPNSMQAQKLTAGLVVLMSPKSMIVIPVATNYRDTKIQQPALIQKGEL